MKYFFGILVLLFNATSAFGRDFILSLQTEVTTSSVNYKFAEVSLQPGDQIFISVPEFLKNQNLSLITLGHRQDPVTHQGASLMQKIDPAPGLTSVQVLARNDGLARNEGLTGWRYWGGPSSGAKGAKFAEPKLNPELENLYEWTSWGSKDVLTGKLSKEPLHIDQIKIENVGRDEIFISQLSLKFIPLEINHHQDIIFSAGTQFSAQFSAKAKLGGGQKFRGTFPGALELNQEIYSIDIEDDVIVRGLEVALGDSHPDQRLNTDQGYGKPGWAKFSMGIGVDEKNISWLTHAENVPPEGLLLAFPKNLNLTKNMKVFLKASEDTVYVMGVRVSSTKSAVKSSSVTTSKISAFKN